MKIILQSVMHTKLDIYVFIKTANSNLSQFNNDIPTIICNADKFVNTTIF